MNTEFMQQLDRCISLANLLMQRLEKDHDYIHEALEGTLQIDYLQGVDKATNVLWETRKQLIQLYQEQEQL